MKRYVLAVLTVGLLVAGDKTKDEDDKKEKGKLKGSWKVVAMEFAGMKVPEEEVKKDNTVLVFEADKITRKGKDKTEDATYVIDPSQKLKEIDITPTDGPEKGKTMKCVYMLDG